MRSTLVLVAVSLLLVGCTSAPVPDPTTAQPVPSPTATSSAPEPAASSPAPPAPEEATATRDELFTLCRDAVYADFTASGVTASDLFDYGVDSAVVQPVDDRLTEVYFEYYFQEQPPAAGYCVVDTSGVEPAVEWRTTLADTGIDIARNRYTAYLDGADD